MGKASPGFDPPYSCTASIYDELMGEALFQGWRENFLRLRKHMRITLRVCADVACGTGLAARYLAEEGARVYGVDISPEMLGEARRRTHGLEVTLLRQDLRELCLPERVDLLTCNGDSLNYLLEAGDLNRALVAFRDNLKPGGYLLFDVNTPYQLLSQKDANIWRMRLGAVRMYWRSTYDQKSGTARLVMSHLEEIDGESRHYREEHRERGYSHDEVVAALERAGFREALCWDACGLGPVTGTTRRLQFLARR